MSSPQFTPNAAIDLTTISIVHKLLRVPLTNDTDDDLIQLCITAASQEWTWRTARGPEGEIATESPFVAPVAYTEVRDGNGSYRLILRNWPITSVESLLGQRTAILPIDGLRISRVGNRREQEINRHPNGWIAVNPRPSIRRLRRRHSERRSSVSRWLHRRAARHPESLHPHGGDQLQAHRVARHGE